MRSVRQVFALGLLLTCSAIAVGADVESYARKVSSLIDPAKLATLRERGANPRVQKYVAQLAEAQQALIAPEIVASRAVEMVGMRGEAAKLTVAAMMRNLTIAERLGCLNAEGLREMRKGQSADSATRAIHGRSTQRRSHHPESGGSGARQRDCQSGVATAPAERE